MVKVTTILLLLFVTFASIVLKAPAEEVTNQPDQLCQMLFDTYIARRGKGGISMEASHIIAERGRNTGFWKIVLRELQSGQERSEPGCVLVLGKMLAIDATARDVIRREKETGRIGQWVASVVLGPEVVKELIARSGAADHYVDYYAIALLRARVPEATDFFRMVLRNELRPLYPEFVKFHAAVGLAQLGEPDGFAWLIENSEDSPDGVPNAWPSWVSNRKIDTCSVAALRDLSGEKNLKSKHEWESWWDKVDKRGLPKGHVRMVDIE